MHNNLDLNLILVFDALLREQNTTRAAEQLGLSQSAVSHALRRLRAAFGDPLFVKIASGLRPTPKAEALADSILSVMEIVRRDLIGEARFAPQASSRRFSFCLTDMGELVFLPPLIQRLRKIAPNCSLRTLQVRQDRIAEALESGDADLAIGSLQSVPGKLFQQRLFTHPFKTIVSSRNTEIGESITLEQFQAMDHIVVTLSGGLEAAYDRTIDELGIRRRVYLVTPHFLVVPLILEREPNLVATVPRELGTVFSQFDAVRVLNPPLDLPRLSLRQFWHPRFHHDEANIWLRNLVKETFEDYPE